jgi:hypothetical protein
MSLPFTTEAFFQLFADYNATWWPVALALWLATAWASLRLFQGHATTGRAMLALLAIHWAWVGIVYHALLFTRINPAAWLFSGLFLVESGLLAHRAFTAPTRLSVSWSARGVLAAGFVLYALAYPAIVLAEGHTFPRMPTFGVPCPTAILTIGVLLTAEPLPAAIAVVPLAWGFIGGSAAFLLEVHADLALLVAGVAMGTVLLLRVILSRRSSSHDGRRQR